MPIYLSQNNKDVVIKKITGSDKIKSHLANMGLAQGEDVFVVSKVNENIIIKVKGVSVALSHELAKRIII